MKTRGFVKTIVIAIATAGCYHQVVQTGATPANTAVDQQFVSTWLWGLVPAKPIDVTRTCPAGVATITTEQSFVNGLVGAVTLGIYTPQHVQIACGSGRASATGEVHEVSLVGLQPAARDSSLAAAVQLMTSTRDPIVIRF